MIVRLVAFKHFLIWAFIVRVANWFDHSRDLLCMVNRFWDRMPRPIIGIAHSMGSAQLYTPYNLRTGTN